jgi:transcriptional regulator with PAS, ATPase and Fis domain
MTPCREWRGAVSHGYGYKWDKDLRKTVGMHRWVVAQIHGWDAIKDKVVMHKCDNKLCYRYDHLTIGTHTSNAADRDTKGRTPYKYDAQQVAEAIEAVRSGESRSSVARRMGISRQSVSYWVAGSHQKAVRR